MNPATPGKSTLGVYIPNEVREALASRAAEDDRTVSYIAARILKKVMRDAVESEAPRVVNFATTPHPDRKP